MAGECTHLDTIRDLTPSAKGCEECLKTGSPWVHLRSCRTCGRAGCCDNSPNRHATKHFHATRHPIIEGYDPPVLATRDPYIVYTSNVFAMLGLRSLYFVLPMS